MSQAADDVIQPAPVRLLSGGLIVNPECGPHDLMNDIDAKLDQLGAGLILTHGGGGESFRAWSDEVQDDYLWGLRESLAQITALWKRYSELMRQQALPRS